MKIKKQTINECVRKLNAPVADALADLAKNFQYEKLLALLQQGEVQSYSTVRGDI